MEDLERNNSLHEVYLTSNSINYKVVDFFLSDVIEKKSDYHDFLRSINSSTGFDTINIHINCYGGDLDAALQIYYSLINCDAKKTIYIEGACMSAATIVMMAANEIHISPWAEIMIHAYTQTTSGKFQELQNQHQFSKPWFEKVVNDIYGALLNKKEISEVLSGADLYISGDELKKKFKKIIKNVF